MPSRLHRVVAAQPVSEEDPKAPLVIQELLDCLLVDLFTVKGSTHSLGHLRN